MLALQPSGGGGGAKPAAAGAKGGSDVDMSREAVVTRICEDILAKVSAATVCHGVGWREGEGEGEGVQHCCSQVHRARLAMQCREQQPLQPNLCTLVSTFCLALCTSTDRSAAP